MTLHWVLFVFLTFLFWEGGLLYLSLSRLGVLDCTRHGFMLYDYDTTQLLGH